MKRLGKILAPVVLLMTAACIQTDTGQPSLMKAQPPALTMAEGLERGYRALAEYETFIKADAETAAHFRQKAEAAAAGEKVPPDDAAGGEEMKEARAIVMDARQTLDSGANAAKVAEAQVNYDCWLHRKKRGDESAQWCEEQFYTAVGNLDLKGLNYTVYFDTAQEVPDEVAFGVIRKAAAAFVDRELWRIHLTGHADLKGSKNQNLMLSMRRALAVRNALAQNGVDLDRIILEAAGADKNAPKETESTARRVEIAIIPAYLDHMGDGSATRKIAPQYFGEEGPDF